MKHFLFLYCISTDLIGASIFPNLLNLSSQLLTDLLNDSLFFRPEKAQMWIEWFIRCSTSMNKWPLRIVCDECKRHRFILSFSPLLFVNHRKADSIPLKPFDWKQNEDQRWKYSKSKSRARSTLLASSVIGALTTAATVFSWENDGVTDKEV